MAKTPKRRHHAQRLLNKWAKLLRGSCLGIDPDGLKFGKVYSSDPLDCGNPNCILCSYGKNLHPKEKRNLLKRDLRDIINSLP